jgi:hypothetical protein
MLRANARHPEGGSVLQTLHFVDADDMETWLSARNGWYRILEVNDDGSFAPPAPEPPPTPRPPPATAPNDGVPVVDCTKLPGNRLVDVRLGRVRCQGE